MHPKSDESPHALMCAEFAVVDVQNHDVAIGEQDWNIPMCCRLKGNILHVRLGLSNFLQQEGSCLSIALQQGCCTNAGLCSAKCQVQFLQGMLSTKNNRSGSTTECRAATMIMILQ